MRKEETMCFRPADVKAQANTCRKCGADNLEYAAICEKCGAALEGPDAAAPGFAAPAGAPKAPGVPKAPSAPKAPGAPPAPMG